MTFTIERQDAVTVIHLPERLDSTNASGVETAVLDQLAGGTTRVVFDFTALDYISSAGLRVVLTVAKRLKAAQGRMAMNTLRPHIREVFDISGFLAILSVYDDLPAAVAFAAG